MGILQDTHLTFTEHCADNGALFYLAEDHRLSHALLSFSVKAGHFYDPDDCHGLAHLLEHMLFMGSRRLPNSNEVIDLIKRCGGNVNAWTAGEHANFHFSCLPQHSPIALPAFFDAMAHPLLKKASIEKEIQSIDAEFAFKKKDDLRRLYQIHKETSNPAHPFSKFSVGNANIYSQHSTEKLQAMLRELHTSRYTSGQIRVVFCAPEIDSKTISTFKQLLSLFPDDNSDDLVLPPLYLADQLQRKISIKPLQNARRLIITFALQTDIHRIKPALAYLSHILGDEGQNSLLAYLKNQGWATNLIAGSGIEGSGFKDFNVSIQLSVSGEAHINTIVEAVFYTLSLVQHNQEDWRWEEKRTLDKLARDYNQSAPTLDTICELAESSWEKHVPAPQLNAETIALALSYFVVDNLRLKHISPNVQTEVACKYYDAEYKNAAVSNQDIQRWRSPRVFEDIQLADQNPYIQGENNLLKRHPEWAVPQLITQTKHYKLWFSQEQRFNSVKGDIYVAFDSPLLTDSAKHSAYKRIWLHAISNLLLEKFYRAGIAGLHFRIYGHQAGFSMHCSGFSSSLMALAAQALDNLLNTDIGPHHFEAARRAQIQSMQNALLNKPINRLFSRLGVIVQRYSFAPVEMLEALKTVDYGDFCTLIAQAKDNLYAESFLHGNWLQEHASDWQKVLTQHQHRFTQHHLSRQILKLTPGKTAFHAVPSEHDDAAVVLYLQAPSCGTLDTAFCMIIEQLLAGPFFNALRTEQQLGYIVGSGYVPHNQHPGLAFYAQSPTHDCETLFQAIIQFLREQINELSFYRGYWPSIQANLLKQISEPDHTLAMQSQRLWLNLGLNDPRNQRHDDLINCIENMQFNDLVDCANSLLARNTFGELVLYSEGQLASFSPDSGISVSNIELFKSNAPFFD
ncbi:peptidase M16 [Alteromonas sediminis]|uniref:Protease 3 n=1 Tax=Alteromonas sediminis TaxID=2259342 RepID=A0A3N5Y3H0_9ALTE|nr:insulinase family protein [Alteromonas sediminis]RPJ68462.1 peptidase M16 [Alteromonas sediminis]